MGALNRKIKRILAESCGAGSRTAAALETFVRERERAAAARSLTLFADEEEMEFNRLLASMPDVFSGLSKERHQKRDEAWERRRSAIRARARAAEIREGKSDAAL